MFMATVKAEDAASSLASWPKFFGLNEIAERISPNADPYALAVGVALLATSGLLWWVGRPNRASGSVFEGQVVRIADLVEKRHPIVMGKTFKNCVIKGPVRLGVLNRNAFNLCQSEGLFFVELPEGSPRGGIVLLENVEFFECLFSRDVCLEATKTNIEQLRVGVEEGKEVEVWKDEMWSLKTKIKAALTRS
ncbi:hypothetical protein ABC955_13350 [Citromicrobium bathyomarinum]